MTGIARVAPIIFVRFAYTQEGVRKQYKGPLNAVQSLFLDQVPLLEKVTVQKRFPDGIKISVFTPEMSTKELLALSEKSSLPEQILCSEDLPVETPLAIWDPSLQRRVGIIALVLLNWVVWAS